MKKSLLLLSGLLGVSAQVSATAIPENQALLVIGASFSNGATPCELNADTSGLGDNVLACLSVGFGDYYSLGAALQANNKVKGQVINTAIGGATTFPRGGFPTALPDGSVPGEATRAAVGWEQYGMNQQYLRAFSQVNNFLTPPATVNAKYVVIDIGNDCLHANAFDESPADTVPDQCALVGASGKTGLEETVDRLIALGQTAIDNGLTPIYTGYPDYVTGDSTSGINFEVTQISTGFSWVISETSYDALVADYNNRIPAELGADKVIMADAWGDFEHFGDGLHPDRATSKKAARKIVRKIRRFERGSDD